MWVRKNCERRWGTRPTFQSTNLEELHLSNNLIRQQFGQHFIQTGELSSELAKALRITHDLRQLGDYDQVVEITKEQAQTALTYAKMFIEQATNWLNNQNQTL